MHSGKKQTQRIISLQEKKIDVTEFERDLGVLVWFDGTWHEQVSSTASKANQVLGLTKNTFSSWPDEIARIIYPTFFM